MAVDQTGPPPPVVWPERLIRPDCGVPLLYLDMFAWIELSKARVGHPTGTKHHETLRLVRELVSAGAINIVLSDSLYFEMHLVTNPRNRLDVAETMVELTGTRYLLGRPSVMRFELDSMVKKVLRTASLFHEDPVHLIGDGLHHAFGVRLNLTIHNADGDDITTAAKSDIGTRFDEVFTAAVAAAELSSLAGPADSELSDLQAHGYKPEVALATNLVRLDQELEQAERFKTTAQSLRRGRLRDAVSAREMIIELNDPMTEVSAPYGTSLITFFAKDLQHPRDFVRGMPSSDVAVAMKTVYFQNPDHPWTTNDINDIDALSVAVPYCDVVLTDSAARHALRREGLETRYNTLLLDKMSGLERWLRSLT
jgi:hypothetical protein